ncbi:transposase [Roseibium sp. RKSG952]|uniref:transposase n=1 Tax=Roseibium sp. RKSG952 TaxID=2529384 RepID=UPI0034CFF52B
MVSDKVWEHLAPLLPGKKSDSGVIAKNNRRLLEAVLWRVRTGLPWRDLPVDFGKWNSVFRRFRRWAKGAFLKEFSWKPTVFLISNTR